MILRLHQIFILSSSLFFALTQIDGDVSGKNADKKWFFENSLPDTTLQEIIEYYEIKLRLIQQKQLEKRANKSETDKDSLYYYDSLYENQIQKRNLALAQKIEISKKGREELKALRYVVFDKHFPVHRADSLFKCFSPELQKEGAIIKQHLKKRYFREAIYPFNKNILNHKFMSDSGTSISLNEINKKYLVLDFWASWCLPCRYENAKLTKLKNELELLPEVSVVLISLDKNEKKWAEANQHDQNGFISLCDFKETEGAVAKEFRIEKIPGNVIIRLDGKIIARNVWGNNLLRVLKNLD